MGMSPMRSPILASTLGSFQYFIIACMPFFWMSSNIGASSGSSYITECTDQCKVPSPGRSISILLTGKSTSSHHCSRVQLCQGDAG